MTTRRSDIVDASNPGVYHCVSRCVRRESLIDDPERREWVVARLDFLTRFMAIDVISFAVMRNHIHLLLAIRPEIVGCWSDQEVAERRMAVLPRKRKRGRNSATIAGDRNEIELAAVLASPKRLANARRDLSNLGFFHRLLKEPCARIWNKADGVTGHFWEGRFKSPRVLDVEGLIQVANYIELNEVHACAAVSIPSSLWTSASTQWRRLCVALQESLGTVDMDTSLMALRLRQIPWEPVFPCRTTPHQPACEQSSDANATPPHLRSVCAALGRDCFTPCLVEYLEVMHHAGARARPDKRGCILDGEPPPTESAMVAMLHAVAPALNIDSSAAAVHFAERITAAIAALITVSHGDFGYACMRGTCYGSAESIRREAARRRCRWLWTGLVPPVAA